MLFHQNWERNNNFKLCSIENRHIKLINMNMENKAKNAFTKFDRVFTTKTTNCKEFIEYLKVYLKACSKPKCLILGRCS